MRRVVLTAALLIAGLTHTVLAAGEAAPAPPQAGDLLFEQPQMAKAEVGSTLVYEYLRRSGISRGPYGPPLSDQIKFTIEPGSSADNRTIRVQMFSGGNRVPAGPFKDYANNPVTLLFLENHLKGLAALLEANPRYLKTAIRKGLREKAEVTRIQTDYKGRSIEAWKVVTRPFVGDAQTERMRGFETLTYTFVSSAEVPGEIVSIEARALNADGGELLEEKISYDQNAG